MIFCEISMKQTIVFYLYLDYSSVLDFCLYSIILLFTLKYLKVGMNFSSIPLKHYKVLMTFYRLSTLLSILSALVSSKLNILPSSSVSSMTMISLKEYSKVSDFSASSYCYYFLISFWPSLFYFSVSRLFDLKIFLS